MNELTRKLPGPHDNVVICTDKIYEFKTKFGPWKYGVKNDSLVSEGPRDSQEVTSQWLPQENPKFHSNLDWLVMVGLEKLHLWTSFDW